MGAAGMVGKPVLEYVFSIYCFIIISYPLCLNSTVRVGNHGNVPSSLLLCLIMMNHD